MGKKRKRAAARVLDQLCMFDQATMASMEKQQPAEPRPSEISAHELAVAAMRETMECGGYDGPETPEEMLTILSNLYPNTFNQ